LQRFEISVLKDELGLQMDGVVVDEDLKTTQHVTVTVDLAEPFQGDVIGVLLAYSLEYLFVTGSLISKLSTELISAQRLDNLLYSQMRVSQKDVKVAGKLYPWYYCYLENYFVSLPPYVFIVITVVPSPDPIPRGRDFAWVSEWLSKFAILENPQAP